MTQNGALVLGFGFAIGAVAVGVWAAKGTRGLNGARRRRGLGGHVEAHELQLFCENDGDLHRRQGSYIEKALEKRMKKDTYNHELAVKGWGHLVESCAKKYVQEQGGGVPWHKMFSVADRREVAQNFADHFKTEYEIQHRA